MALSAITGAVVGVILNLALWFAVHTVFRQTREVRAYGLSFDAPIFGSLDIWALLLDIAAALAVFRFKVGVIQPLAYSCAAGIVLYLLSLVPLI